MAKVLFVNPVIRQEDDPRHVPYGMALLVAIADKCGHQVQVFDANAHRPADEHLREALEADSWDVVATGGITTTYSYAKKVMQYAKRYAPQALTVMGGGGLTAMPRDVLTFVPEIDLGVVGEALVTFPEILNKVNNNDFHWESTKGIIYRDQQGDLQLTPPRPLLRDLDGLPYPAWEMFPLDIYFRNSSLLLSEIAMQSQRRLDINGSYGCSLICRFCYHLGLSGDMEYVETTGNSPEVIFTHSRDLRWHSPHYIVKLAKYAHERFGVDYIAFLDENLMTMDVASRRTWMSQICDLWIKEGLQPQCIRERVPHDQETCRGVHWGGTSHAQLVTPEVLRHMHEAGCTHLDYGLESFSARVLKNIGKGTRPEGNERAIQMTMEAGIRPIPNQIIGFPDEWFDSIRDNLDAWERTGIQAKPFFATPFPGSEWYFKYKDRIIEQYGGDLEAFIIDLGDATKITAVISENFNAVELLGLRELMVQHDRRHIDEYERIWRSLHGEPKFPDVRWAPAAVRRETHAVSLPRNVFASEEPKA